MVDTGDTAGASGLSDAACEPIDSHVDGLTTPLWVFDIDNSRVAWANKAAIELWDAQSLEDLTSRDMSADMSVAVRTRLLQHQEDFEAQGASFNELWTVYPNGAPRHVRVVFSGFRLKDGRMAMLCEALEEEFETPETLRSAEALLHTSVMISLYATDGRLLHCNPAARASHRAIGQTLASRFADPAEHAAMSDQLTRQGECRLAARVRTTQGVRWHEITARECRDAVTGSLAYLITENDISDLKETERRVRYLADHDVLTGLPNRNYIQTRLPHQIMEALSSGIGLTFLIIDLDRFKAINDTLGHTAGDELLVKVGARLKRVVGNAGVVARLGGDEFLICLKNTETLPCGRNVVDAVKETFAERVVIRAHKFVITPSIGVSRFPEDGTDLSTLLINADLALYQAKEDGRNTCVRFSRALQERVEEQTQLEKDLQRAIDEDQFELFYQPRVDARTGLIVGAEALLRWCHPTRGLLAPGSFMSICEETGLINDIGRSVMRKVAAVQCQLVEKGHDILLSLNLSPRQFGDPSFRDTVLGLAGETGCDPARLELEITESLLMSDDDQVIEQLDAFRESGFSIAIDDFGTGFCNLAYIQRYPITCLKIDRSFISNIETNGAVTALIMSLCHLIGVKSVAEGVETEAQLAWLRERNCDEYQGYLFSKPVPFDDFLDILDAPIREDGNVVVLKNVSNGG